MNRRLLRIAVLAAACAIGGASNAFSQASDPGTAEPAPAAKNDTNPTRPVLFSIRPELYQSGVGLTRTTINFRYDQATMRQRRWLPGKRGMILRFELPLTAVRLSGADDQFGVGDAYGQVLLLPYLTRARAFAVGTGLLAPTASDRLLGAGKWVIAPAVAPVWFFEGRGRGMFLVLLQNYSSFAGDASKPDINFLQITPSFLQTVGRGWWILADSRVKTDWLRDRRTGVRSGLQIGRNFPGQLAIWVKPEAWWGPNRDGRWNLTTGFVWYR